MGDRKEPTPCPEGLEPPEPPPAPPKPWSPPLTIEELGLEERMEQAERNIERLLDLVERMVEQQREMVDRLPPRPPPGAQE